MCVVVRKLVRKRRQEKVPEVMSVSLSRGVWPGSVDLGP